MKRILLSVIILSVLSFAASAQKMVRGKVFDATGKNPLAGATISFQGKGVTTTDKDGMFSVDCNKVSRVTVSFIGYETISVPVRNCNDELSIALVASGKTMENVDLTATSNPNKSLLYLPASLTKLNPTELKRNTGLFFDDAINGNVPGVSMNRRSVSGGQQFNIRGYGNGTRGTRGVNSNFDGQGYKVYLNGIPITDAEGVTTLDDIDFASIGNAEITKGPAGTLYGLAISGVINLNTIKPEKGKTSIGEDIMIGNYGLQRYTTHFEMGTERAGLLVNYGHQHSDGFSIHNASHKDFVNIAANFQPNEKQSVNGFFGYSNSYDERLGELTLTQWAMADYSGNPDYIKRNAHSNVITFRGGLGHTWNFSKNVSNTSTVFGTGFTSNSSSAAGWTDKNTINYGFRTSFDMRFSLGNNSLTGITGMETQTQNGQTIGYNMKQNPADPNPTWTLGSPYWVINAMTSNTAYINGTTSYFTEWTLGLPHDFSITAGIGVSNMKITLDDRFNPQTSVRPAHFFKKYESMVSPHFAINKVFSKMCSFYASYSKGYKAPVGSYFFVVIPNSNSANTSARVIDELKPEIGNQYEIGTKGSLMKDRFSYQLAFFDAVFSNKMTAVYVPLNGTTTAYNYTVNGGKQKDIGVEALIKYTAYESDHGCFRSIKPFANIAYSHFRYENFKFQTNTGVTSDYSGLAVGGVPKWTYNLGVDVLTQPGIYGNVNFFHKSAVPITSDGVNWTGSYSLLNTKLGYQHSFGGRFDLDLFFGIGNLAGTRYPIMVFVNQLPDAYIPAPPKANFYGGVNFKFIL